MKKDRERPTGPAAVRARAEARLREKRRGETDEAGAASPTEDAARLLHELQVSQVELEMQNEQLRSAQAELEAGRALYAELYDFAATGYLSLDRAGAVRMANLSGARLFGVERSRLVNRRCSEFVAERDRRAFVQFLEQAFAGQKAEPVRGDARAGRSAARDRAGRGRVLGGWAGIPRVAAGCHRTPAGRGAGAGVPARKAAAAGAVGTLPPGAAEHGGRFESLGGGAA